MNDLDFTVFQKNLRKHGLYYIPSEETRLYEIALRCSRTIGLAGGLTGAAKLAGVATVTVPVIGTIPGAVAGFLVGVAAGTALCTMGYSTMKPQVDELLKP